MREIQNLEIHVAHTCNLSCQSCSHYSDQGHKGILSIESAYDWMGSWASRLRPKKFTLLGGEPTTNNSLSEIVTISREFWPTSHLRIVTNGMLLHRHSRLARALANAGNAGIYVSIHHDSNEYLDRLIPVRALLKQWHLEYGIHSEFIPSYTNWTRRYKGTGSEMQPYSDRDPAASWKNCPARFCPQLYLGNLWKCGPIAYLGMQHEKFELSQDWHAYLQYKGLKPNCTEQDLNLFFDTKEIPECGMCPANPQQFSLDTPIFALRAR